MLTLTVTSFALCAGAGGFLTATLKFSCVIIVPVPVNVPEASLASAVEPCTGITPSAAAVTLKVFVPDLKTTGGSGVAFAFLKKNAPIKSPQLSENKSILVTEATAPLVSPTICAPFTAYPKYSSKVPNAVTSIFKS